MTFKSVESLSFARPYSAVNEDAFFIADDLAVVIDGATGLCPARIPGVMSDAAWFSHSLVHELKASWERGADFPEVLEHCLARLRTQWFRLTGSVELGPIELQPVAAMSAVQLKGSTLVFYRLADCSAFIRAQGAGCSVFAPSKLSEADAQNIEWMSKSRPEDMDLDDARKMSLHLLLDTRSKTNVPGYWGALSLDAVALKTMDRFELSLEGYSGELDVVLTSDGYSSLIDDYFPQMGETVFTYLCTKSLSGTYNLVRDVERTDPLGLRFPRFKIHDDATAVHLQLRLPA